MNTQLVLIDDTPPDWQLPDETRQIGRRGVRDARRALDVAVESNVSTPESGVGTSRRADQAA